jgi:hypothetical protein
MKRTAITIATLALLLGTSHAQEIKLRVKVISTVAPTGALMESDANSGNYEFNKDAASGVFTSRIPAPDVDKIKAYEKIVSPHRIVVSWPDSREQLFIGLRSPLPSALEVSVYREPVAFDEDYLRKIDALPSDLESTLQKYFRARTFHNYWRFKNQATFYLALRSAKIWFDAATRLATRPNSIFMMDPDVKAIMSRYEEMAKTDSKFKQRLREHTGAGYVAGTLSQISAVEFSSVGMIPRLKGEGRIEEARMINTKALATLADAPDDVRESVLKHQRIDVELLKANQRVLE